MIHLWFPWKLPNFQDLSPPPCPFTSKILPSPWPWTSNFKLASPPSTPSPQMIINQLKENIIQEWLLYVIRSFLQVGFPFQYQLINLVELSFDLFPFSWSPTICFFVPLYSCVCSCKHKRTMEQQPHRECEWNQNKNKTKHVTFELTTHSIVRLSPNNAMVSLKDDFTVWRQRQKKDFLSIYCLAQHDVWSWRKSNYL